MEHQKPAYLQNQKPFVDSNVLLGEVRVEVDIMEKESCTDSNISHIVSNFYVLSDEEKLIVLNKEMTAKNTKERRQPVEQRTCELALEERFKENDFARSIESAVRYKVDYNEDDQKSLASMCPWSDVL